MRAFTRVFRTAAALACVMSLVSCLSQQDRIVSARPPNIVIFLADDLGYRGLGVQGDREVSTPNIDALAKSGVRLTDFYANHPVCSPSRAALLTGAYQHRMGFENNSGPPAAASPRFGIGLDTPTLPERLKQAGYTTGMFGKWHVGFQREMWPTSRGFDSFYGFLSGAHPFTPEGVSGSRVVRCWCAMRLLPCRRIRRKNLHAAPVSSSGRMQADHSLPMCRSTPFMLHGIRPGHVLRSSRMCRTPCVCARVCEVV
jgi:hypothetical protein